MKTMDVCQKKMVFKEGPPGKAEGPSYMKIASWKRTFCGKAEGGERESRGGRGNTSLKQRAILRRSENRIKEKGRIKRMKSVREGRS